MNLRGVEATGPATLTLSRLRTAGIHLRNTSGLDREGLARAMQLAGLALADTARQHTALRALHGCLNDRAQMAQITGPGLCHGIAGLYQAAWRIATDTDAPAITSALPDLTAALLTPPPPGITAGFLEGQAGLALVLHTAASRTPSATSWDSCLLLG